MKARAFGWLLWALLPGCLFVQPLDEAKSDAEANAGRTSSGNASAGGASGSGTKPSGGAGPTPAGGRGGSPPGGAGGPAQDPLLAFTGIWVLTDGAITLNCGGTHTTSALSDGSADWQIGTTSDLVQTAEGASCELRANVSARVAIGDGTQYCTESGLNPQGSPYTQNLSIDNYTFTLSSNGMNAKEAFSGTIDYTDLTTYITSTCDFTQTGNYYKQ